MSLHPAHAGTHGLVPTTKRKPKPTVNQLQTADAPILRSPAGRRWIWPYSLAKPGFGMAGARQACCDHASTQGECKAPSAATRTLLEALCTQWCAAGFPGGPC